MASTFDFTPLQTGVFDRVSAVCIGTGRFLRAVLVPTLVELGGEVVLAQTRGDSFGQYMKERPDGTYEVDTILQDGGVLTSRLPVAACGTLGTQNGREAFMRLPKQLPALRYIGLGLTEAGIAHNSQSIIDLAEFIHACFLAGHGEKRFLSLINTDNLPFNGDAIRNHVYSCDFTQRVAGSAEFQQWMDEHVLFHNSMVDRITSHRAGNPDVPRAEPLPAKALVIEDLTAVLPQQFGSVNGVAVRTKAGQLAIDIALKLRVANGTHTAMVYVMALARLFTTDCCIGRLDILPYLEQLFERDIVNCCQELDVPRIMVTPVFSEWLSRLQHPHFGLECLFVCQNASQKLGIRLLPSVKATLAAGESPSEFMIFALAVVLRFLTPIGEQSRLGEYPPVFVGRLDLGSEDKEDQETTAATGGTSGGWEYTKGLRVVPKDGTYEFRDGDGVVPLLLMHLGRPGSCNAAAAVSLARDVLSRIEGFQPLSVPEHGHVASAVGQMLFQMLHGKPALQLLQELRPLQPLLLDSRHLEGAVRQEVEAAEAIDVHTHLFSSGYGPEHMQYGIDALLTYHYLVAEYLATSAEPAQEFYALSQREQANRVWRSLFVDTSPLSEQCRGVLTTLSALGLNEALAFRDLESIRSWYAGQDADMFNEKMMRLSRLRYIVTSHDPFEPEEIAGFKSPPPQPPRYKRALSLDKLLEGDWKKVCAMLSSHGEEPTLAGVAALLKRCVSLLQPIFLTAATPHDFSYVAPNAGQVLSSAVLDTPIPDLEQRPSPQQVLDAIVIPLCLEAGLALSLRMGTRRAVNPELQLAGDGVGPAQLDSLGRLCQSNPKVKFLGTVLGRGDQQELAVLASKFRNLHIWGCWWYCSNPSIVSEVTALRLEILGTGFTYQASSARVHDQLIYKWIHARTLLVRLLVTKYIQLMDSGWKVSRRDVRRDVQRLLGGAFEEFMAKVL